MSLKYYDIINYSEYSIGSGSLRLSEIIKNPNNNKIAGLTDQATLSGIPFFLSECSNNGIKGIVGTTVSVTYVDEFVGQLILIAKNDNGYFNISKILSMMGEYHNEKIRKIDLNDILKNKEDILVVDGFSKSILDKQLNEIQKYKEIFKILKDNFNNNLIFTIQGHESDHEKEKNKFILKKITTVKDFNLKVFLSNNNRYAKKDERNLFLNRVYEFSELKGHSNDPEKINDSISKILEEYSTEDHILTGDELVKKREPLFNFLEKNNYLITEDFWIKNIEKINIFDKKVVIEKVVNRNLKDDLRLKWLDFRDSIPKEEHNKYLDRIKYELKIIEEMNYSDYFNLTNDITFEAHNLGYLTAIRGSGAGSLICKVLGLSNVDPIKYNLMFERFLNPERNELPDLDLDISHPLETLKKISEKYDNVANLVKFTKTKSAKITTEFVISSLRRFHNKKEDFNFQSSLNIIENKLKYLYKFLKYKKGDDLLLSNLIVNDEYWKKNYNSDNNFKRICNLALLHEGKIINKSINSSSIIVSKNKINNIISTFDNHSSNGLKLIAELTKDQSSFVKYDILSNQNLEKNLSILNQRGITNTKLTNNYSDENVYLFISKGHTFGLTQTNAQIGTNMCKEIKPSCFEDLIAINALIRFGYMDDNNKPEDYLIFLNGKNNPDAVIYKHPILKSILQETYGAFIYEEQVIRIAMEIGNLTFSEADKIRSTIKNKNNLHVDKLKEVILEYKEKFILGAKKLGINNQDANNIFLEIENKIGKFVFSKAHSAAYADIMYNQMYLKLKYPAEFMYAYCINKRKLKNGVVVEEGDHFKILKEFNDMGFIIKRPSINESDDKTKTITLISELRGVKYTTILASINDAFKSKDICSDVINERQINGSYRDLLEYIDRILPIYLKESYISPNINLKKVEEFIEDTKNLINIGAFDFSITKDFNFDINKIRTILLENINKIVSFVINFSEEEDFILDDTIDILPIEYFIEIEKNILNYSPCEINILKVK